MGSIFNWIDQTESGYQVIRDPAGNEKPGRPYLRFLGNCTVVDNAVTNSTDVTIVVDLSDATPLATPNTIVKRDGIAGAAFGPLSGTVITASTSLNTVGLEVSGLSEVGQLRATELDLKVSGTTQWSALYSSNTAILTSVGSTLVRSIDVSSGGTGAVRMLSGSTTAGVGTTGTVQVGTGISAGGDSGPVQIFTGSAFAITKTSGGISLATGAGGTNTGAIQLTTGTGGASSGDIIMGISGAPNTGSIRLNIANGTTTTGSVVASVGTLAAPGNFAISRIDMVPNYVGGKGVLYLARCQTAPGPDATLSGGMLYFDAAGNFWVRTSKGAFQLY